MEEEWLRKGRGVEGDRKERREKKLQSRLMYEKINYLKKEKQEKDAPPK